MTPKHSYLPHFPLRRILIIPFVVQIAATVGLVGYLSFRNSQQTVRDLVNQLMTEVNARIHLQLDAFLQVPPTINQLSVSNYQLGLLDLDSPTTLDRYFWSQAQSYPSIDYIEFGAADGSFFGLNRLSSTEEEGIVVDGSDGIYHAYDLDDQGQRSTLLYIREDPYDPRGRPWYQTAMTTGRPVWGDIYVWVSRQELGIPAVHPVYDPQAELIGVLGAEFRLARISRFLQQLKIGQTGQAFIIERTGLLVANSTTDPLFQQEAEQPPQRMLVTQSQNAMNQAAIEVLQSSFNSFEAIESRRLEVSSDLYGTLFVQVDPFTDALGLDWLIVVVVPETDFTEAITAQNRTTIGLSVLAVVIATGLGILTARWITRPILTLNASARGIARGEWNPVDTNHNTYELSELSQSFNRMATELQVYQQSLEDKVAERTQALQNTLTQLQKTQQELIQSEKMASLGQLIAGIAHEINTPLGAINSSIQNVTKFWTTYLPAFMSHVSTLSSQQREDLFSLLSSTRAELTLSTREHRQIRKQLGQQLTAQGVTNASVIAKFLLGMGITTLEDNDRILRVLKDPDADHLLKLTYQVATARTSTETIETAVDRASRVVSALKRYARYSRSSEKVLADVTEGIETVLTLYQNQIKYGIEVIRDYAPDLPRILCYPDELSQVWANLIYNALQAMEFQGILTLRIHQQPSALQVSITDTGRGIPADILPHIFEPFFTTKLPGEGSGIGLGIALQIVEKHQGQIEVTSVPGQTTFRVSIPCA